MLGNTDGINREDFPCLMKQSLEKACTTVPNISGWTQYGVYTFDHDTVWRVSKVDIASADA